MSTTGRGRHTVLRIFKGRRGRTGHHATCGALPAAGPYLRLSRFRGGQAVKQKRELFPRPPPTSPDSLTLPSAATSGSGILTRFPFEVSAQLGTVTRLPVHPASPVRLPKMAHLELSIPWRGSTEQPRRPTYLKFENRSRALRPDASNHWLYPIELALELRLSEGNFGGNQLLDGSISLSPLYPSQTNDLHVSIAAGLHQSFLWLRPARA
ncbi:hypothetical protein K1719_047193 [Acacia pycnantha]|nr:hypothetical protein K1719_047193 [Acacia pycnantha]